MASPRAVTSVLIADDDAEVRSALIDELDAQADFTVIGEAADGETALAMTGLHRPALVLVDVQMPSGGPALVRSLTAGRQSPVVAGLSANAHASTWTQMLVAGASGYLLKGALHEDLPSLLRRVLRGELIVTVPGASILVRDLLTGPRQPGGATS